MTARLRGAAPALAALAALATLASGCRGRWLFGPFQRRGAAAEEPLSWTPLPAGTAVDVIENERGSVRYRLALPPAAVGAGALRRVELSFHDPLDGARVEAQVVGSGGWLTVIDDRRIGGDTVAIPIPPGDLDRVELAVHHHLRPLPVVREVRLGRATSPRGPGPR